MHDDQTRYATQIEKLGVQIQALDFEVTMLHPDDGHPVAGLRIHIADETAELVCLYSPLGDIEGLEDLDLLNVVLSRAENLAEHRPAAEAVIAAVNETCPFGHFGMRSSGDLYFQAEYITQYDALPEITSFADSLVLISFADLSLRPAILEVQSGRDATDIITELRTE